MNLHDYLIDHTGFQWQDLFERWKWCVPSRFKVWLMNRFGDLFIFTEDGKVHWLRMDDGTLVCVAESRDDFCDKLDVPSNANDWLLIPLVDRLVASGKPIGKGECYGFSQLPLLGGDYTPENVVVRDIGFHFDMLGQLYEQMKDLPDGTAVQILVKRGKEDGEPGATDNPDDAQRSREDH